MPAAVLDSSTRSPHSPTSSECLLTALDSLGRFSSLREILVRMSEILRDASSHSAPIASSPLLRESVSAGGLPAISDVSESILARLDATLSR